MGEGFNANYALLAQIQFGFRHEIHYIAKGFFVDLDIPQPNTNYIDIISLTAYHAEATVV